MTFIEFLQTYNGALMFLATIISAITTIIIAFISYKNLKELKVTREEENRPYIVLYIDKFNNLDQKKYVFIKNFGKTAGIVKSIEIHPEIQPVKLTLVKVKPIDTIKNMYLAPNQRMLTMFDKKNNDNNTSFDITLTYTTADRKKEYIDKYTIDLEYMSTTSWSLPKHSDNTTKELNYIANSIQGLIEKLH